MRLQHAAMVLVMDFWWSCWSAICSHKTCVKQGRFYTSWCWAANFRGETTATPRQVSTNTKLLAEYSNLYQLRSCLMLEAICCVTVVRISSLKKSNFLRFLDPLLAFPPVLFARKKDVLQRSIHSNKDIYWIRTCRDQTNFMMSSWRGMMSLPQWSKDIYVQIDLYGM